MQEATISGSHYKDAGVNIEAGNNLVALIREDVASTARPGSDASIGGFGGFFDPKAAGYKDPLLVMATDGVGTKLRVAIETGRHETVGIDLVAMCVNDLIVQGAEPLAFLDYFATSKLDVDVAANVVTGIAAGCREAGCALVGGESAEMPGMYTTGDYDLAGFAVGAVERGREITGQTIRAGDVVLGLSSSGIHSNGFSLVRKIIAERGLTMGQPAPWGSGSGKSLGEALLTPTHIYAKALLPGVRQGLVKGMAHITGGGLMENIPRMLPAGLGVHLDALKWPFRPVFRWLMEEGGISEAEMARTFNCGLGMVLVTSRENERELGQLLCDDCEDVYRIGEVVALDGGDPRVTITHVDRAWNAGE